jgi:hypothetical protein
MKLRDWLNQNWPDDSVPMDVVIAIGAGVTRCLAEAWDCNAAQVHGALSEDAIRVDQNGHLRVVGFAGNGDRIAHQRDLRATGRLLYAMLMNETPHEKGPRDADPVLAVLAAIRASSLQRARERVQVAHPVVGSVIARLLATGEEHGFLHGWAVAEALDNLAALPVETALEPQVRSPVFPESKSKSSDSTMCIAVVRSGDRAAPVRVADRAPKKIAPPPPMPPNPRHRTHPRAREHCLC